MNTPSYLTYLVKMGFTKVNSFSSSFFFFFLSKTMVVVLVRTASLRRFLHVPIINVLSMFWNKNIKKFFKLNVPFLWLKKDLYIA